MLLLTENCIFLAPSGKFILYLLCRDIEKIEELTKIFKNFSIYIAKKTDV